MPRKAQTITTLWRPQVTGNRIQSVSKFLTFAAIDRAGKRQGSLAPAPDGEAFAAHKFVVRLGYNLYDEFIEDDGARELLAF